MYRNSQIPYLKANSLLKKSFVSYVKARGFNFGVNLHLFPFFVCVSSKDLDLVEIVQTSQSWGC